MNTPEETSGTQDPNQPPSGDGTQGQAVHDGPILELAGISVHYGAVVALNDVSLGVRRGEVVAVMGPNGAGKSTVLKAIMGLAPVVAGEVHLAQSPARRCHSRDREGRHCVRAAGPARLHASLHRGKPGDGLPAPE